MIAPFVSNFVSPDIPEVWNWNPPSADAIHYFLEMTIGSTPDKGDIFGLTIVSAEWLLRKSEDKAYWGHYCLVIREYSWDTVVRYIQDAVRSCAADDWHTTAKRLSRHFRWEYQDYQER